MVVCFGGSTGVARERTRFSLVALRRRLSPVLPLSLTSREACDPAVQNLYYLLKRPPPMVSYYFFSWATIFPKEGSRPQGLTAPRPKLRAQRAQRVAVPLAQALANIVPDAGDSNVTERSRRLSFRTYFLSQQRELSN